MRDDRGRGARHRAARQRRKGVVQAGGTARSRRRGSPAAPDPARTSARPGPGRGRTGGPAGRRSRRARRPPRRPRRRPAGWWIAAIGRPRMSAMIWVQRGPMKPPPTPRIASDRDRRTRRRSRGPSASGRRRPSMTARTRCDRPWRSPRPTNAPRIRSSKTGTRSPLSHGAKSRPSISSATPRRRGPTIGQAAPAPDRHRRRGRAAARRARRRRSRPPATGSRALGRHGR